MTQDVLFLLVVGVAGIYAVRWSLRLAPLGSELPAKTLFATLLSVLVAIASMTGTTVPDGVRLLALVIGPLFIFGPLALVGLARAGRYEPARLLGALLYWTPAGRAALYRLLTQVALQRGDAAAAKSLIPDRDPLLLAQALALQGAWQELLELELPHEGDNAALGEAARIEALIALGRLPEAAAALQQLEKRWHQNGEGPLGYRALRLSEARLAAARGALEEARRVLAEPLTGVPAHQLFAILGRAAENGGQPELASQLFERAYVLAPAGQQPRYAEVLRRYERPLPKVQRPTRPYGTYALAAALVASYLVQLWLEQRFGANAAVGVAGFALNIAVPEPDALWRYLSYAFVHGNLVHIGFNVWVLIDLSRLYEGRRGWGNLLAAFVFGTAMGAYLTAIAQGGTQLLLIGASGGVLGVAGALLADVLRSRKPADRLLLRSLLQWMAIIVIFSVAVPNVSLWGHVGGVVGGLLWGFVRQGLPAGRRIDLFAGGLSIGVMAYALTQAVRVAVQQLF